jgi:CelD/BcsL family acetyltransferase involved in cellulose biosynthesis
VELRRAFALALGVQTLVALPAGVGLVLVADSAVPLLLGPQWLAAVPVLQVLALVSVTTALTHSSAYLLLALGKVRVQALFVWGHFLLLAALLIAVFPRAGVQEIAEVRLAVATVAMLAFLGLALRAVPGMRARDILGSCWRPVLGTAVMYLTLSVVQVPDTWPLALRCAATIAAGGALYAAAILLLWRTAGRPDGAETYLLAKLRPSMHASATGDTSVAEPSRGNSETDGLVVVAARTTAELPVQARALLESAGQPNPELGRVWFDNLQRTVYPDDAGVRYYAACRDGDECVAVLPLRRSTRGRVRTIESLSNFYTSLYAPALAEAATAADIAALLRRAIADLGNPHEIRLAPMDPDSRAFLLLESALAMVGWVSYRYFCFGNWYLDVDRPWSEYLLGRPGEVQSTIKRNARKFAAAGGTIEIVCDVGGIDAATIAYGEVYAASWKKPEPYPEFIPGLIRDLATAGSLRLGVARIGGEPVAAQIWSVRARRAAIIKLAHDKGRPEYSPGTLLTAKLMEHAIEVDRVVAIDYLIGDDAYKQNWMARRRERWGIVAYNPRTLAGFLLLVREAAGRVMKAAKARIIRKPVAPIPEPVSSRAKQGSSKSNMFGDSGNNPAT